MILVLFLGGLLTAPQAAPPLPDLALSTLPPAAREVLSRVYQEAVKRPSDPEAAGMLGKWLHAWEQWESAHEAYARSQALAPGAFEWHYLDGVVLGRLARHAEAAARFADAVHLRSDYLPARIKLAEAQLDAGDLEGSGKLFDALVKEPAAEPAARVGLGRIAALAGQHDLAVQHFERAIALFPELGAAHYGLARSYRALGRHDAARRALQQHSKYGPRWPGMNDVVLESIASLREDPRALLKRGISSAAAGEIESAIADHQAALTGDPSLVNAHANLLSLYGRVKNFDKAEAHYRAALAAGFSTADLHYDYGVVLSLQEKYEAAEDSYRRAIAANPLHAHARNNLGQLVERRRDLEGAAAEYRAALEAQPSFRLARFNLGRMLLARGKPEEARVELEKIQQPRDAEAPRYLFALATAHVRAGRPEEGIRFATDAQHLATEHGQHDLAAAIARELAALKR